jgi:hypothetical protein
MDDDEPVPVMPELDAPFTGRGDPFADPLA